MGAYLAKGVGAAGAGDILMSFLGPVVLSFGFRIYGQRALLRRHAAEVSRCHMHARACHAWPLRMASSCDT